ncbi:Solute carrier family 25 member 44 [Bienertia sinuspersici]
MLDKSRFFFLGAALFSGVSGALYPAVVLKTRQQVSMAPIPCSKMAFLMFKQEGPRSFYRGFGTSLMGTIPARALYMAALEVTKSNIGKASVKVGFSETSSITIANAAAGLSASMAAQLVWTPVDVVSTSNYSNGFDAFRKILSVDGIRGLYRGFGISTLTYAPSSAVWWGSYSVAYRCIWDGVSCYKCKWKKPNPMFMVGVQGVSAALASGVSALITMPLDTVKTRLQVLEGEQSGRGSGRRWLKR